MCNGQSTSIYPALAVVVGANVPDLRGEFIRGADLGRGVDSGRLVGSSQSDAIRNITGWFGADDRMFGTYGGAFYLGGGSNTGSEGTGGGYYFVFDASRVVPTADENRPRNVALLPCIKY